MNSLEKQKVLELIQSLIKYAERHNNKTMINLLQGVTYSLSYDTTSISKNDIMQAITTIINGCNKLKD